jgi:two-component system LytT family response regulator
MNATFIPTLYYSYQHKLPIDLSQVVRLEGTGNYTTFILIDGTRHLSSKSLCVYERYLSMNFVRIHKSCLINRRFVVEFNKGEQSVLMADGSKVKASRRKKGLVKKMLLTFSIKLQ